MAFTNGAQPNLTYAKPVFEIAQSRSSKISFTLPIFNATKISPHFSAVKKSAVKVKFVPYISSHTLQNAPSQNNLNRINIVKFDPRFYYG